MSQPNPTQAQPVFDINAICEQALVRLRADISEDASRHQSALRMGFEKSRYNAALRNHESTTFSHAICINGVRTTLGYLPTSLSQRFEMRSVIRIQDRVVAEWDPKTLHPDSIKLDVPYILWLWLRNTTPARVLKIIWRGVK